MTYCNSHLSNPNMSTIPKMSRTSDAETQTPIPAVEALAESYPAYAYLAGAVHPRPNSDASIHASTNAQCLRSLHFPQCFCRVKMFRTLLARSRALSLLSRNTRRGLLTKAFAAGPTEVPSSSSPLQCGTEVANDTDSPRCSSRQYPNILQVL
jgi:hypothetical protein